MSFQDEFVSISELAKMRNITTETLRHYDRIGLICPDYRDKNGVRYYSVQKVELLGTISELKQLGIPLAEMKDYISHRTLSSSCQLLRQYRNLITQKLEELHRLEKEVNEKLAYMEDVRRKEFDNDIHEKNFEDRYFILSNRQATNDINLGYLVAQLEKQIHSSEKYLPIYASTRYAGLIKHFQKSAKETPAEIMIQVKAPENHRNVICCPGGLYLCLYHRGSFWNAGSSIERIMKYAEQKGLELEDTIIENVIVDCSITDEESERILELQIRERR